MRVRAPTSIAPKPIPATQMAATKTGHVGASAARARPSAKTTSADASTRPPVTRRSAHQQMTTPRSAPTKLALSVMPAVAIERSNRPATPTRIVP